MRSIILLGAAALLGLGGCATSSTAGGERPGAPAVRALPQGAGYLNERLMDFAASARDVRAIHVDTGEGGEVVKLSITHGDAGAIPEAVHRLARERFPQGKVTAYETELYAKGGDRFEVEVVNGDGRPCEVSAGADGVFVYEGCSVAPWELDQATRTAIEQVVPGGIVASAERKEGPGLNQLFIDVRAPDGAHELRFEGGAMVGHLRSTPSIVRVPAKESASLPPAPQVQ